MNDESRMTGPEKGEENMNDQLPAGYHFVGESKRLPGLTSEAPYGWVRHVDTPDGDQRLSGVGNSQEESTTKVIMEAIRHHEGEILKNPSSQNHRLPVGYVFQSICRLKDNSGIIECSIGTPAAGC